MRHGKKFNHLGRKAAHRKAMLANMASSLILHKRITTTLAKAKALRKYVEPILTKSKLDTTHSRRVVFSYLQDKTVVKELFDEVAQKISTRPGGYTRIIKLGNRLGDNAEICMMELVDYNTTLVVEEKEAKETRSTRRRRRKKKSSDETSEVQTTTETTTEEANEIVEDTTTNEAEKVEETKEEGKKEE